MTFSCKNIYVTVMKFVVPSRTTTTRNIKLAHNCMIILLAPSQAFTIFHPQTQSSSIQSLFRVLNYANKFFGFVVSSMGAMTVRYLTQEVHQNVYKEYKTPKNQSP